MDLLWRHAGGATTAWTATVSKPCHPRSTVSGQRSAVSCVLVNDFSNTHAWLRAMLMLLATG